MEIELSKVGPVPKRVELRFGRDRIDLDPDGSLTGDAVFHGEVFGRDGRAHVAGTITADVVTTCSRCLEPVEKHFEIGFDDIFIDASEERPDAEAEISEEQLDESLVI